MHYVVVGNGIAGMEAALVLRRRDENARITIVSDEHDHFFSRPALMYVFAGQLRLKDTEPYDRELYSRMGFERVRERVTALDGEGSALVLASGERLKFDRLLLATGSRARPAPWPGSAGSHLHAFVTLRDLEALDAAARKGQRAVIVGGGLIGVEVAEILHQRGLHVTFVMRQNWYFPLALDGNESAVVAGHLREQGVDVRVGMDVTEIRRAPSGAVAAVRAGDTELPADLVVATIGVIPNTAFLAGSTVRLAGNGAIETDPSLRTSDGRIWAAGDCAEVEWEDGSRRPEQLWYTARDQGRTAAAAMLGDAVAYRRGTWYNSAKFFDLEYTTAGFVPVLLNSDNTLIDPGPRVKTWFQRVPGRAETQRIILRDECVVGFNLLGSRWNHEPLLEWIAERRSLDWVLAHMREAQFDEEFSRRFVIHPGAGLLPAASFKVA